MEELTVDILMNKMIICDAKQYHSFVREALLNQKQLHLKGGDHSAANVIKFELERLDCLHQRMAVPA